MPGIGGRLGWNEPPPAATITTLHSNILPASVVTRNSGSPMRSMVCTISPKWNCGPERLDLLEQSLGQAIAGHHRDAGNVVDRLFRIKLGALATWLCRGCRRDAALISSRPSSKTANNPQGPAPMISASVLMVDALVVSSMKSPALGQSPALITWVRTSSPSSSSLILIWHDSREFARTS